MKLDMVLLEKFIVELSVPKAKIHINGFFKDITTGHANEMFMRGTQLLQPMIKQDEPMAYAAINGILWAMTICYTSHDPEVKKYIEGYLEHRSRVRGENCVDLSIWRAGKKNL